MALKLGNITQILEMVGLKDQVPTINDFAKQNKIYAGDAAVQMKLISQEKMDAAVLAQGIAKAEAAFSDVDTIIASGTQEHPSYLKANFGNNETATNKSAPNPPVVTAVSAVANMAQNMVMLANKNPEIAKDIKPSVEAAKVLVDALSAGKGISQEQAQSLTEAVTSGLKYAADTVGTTDDKAKVDAFIAERAKEIQTGVAVSLAQQQQSSPSTSTSVVAPQTPAPEKSNGFVKALKVTGVILGIAASAILIDRFALHKKFDKMAGSPIDKIFHKTGLSR